MSSSQLEQGTDNKIKELDQNVMDLPQEDGANTSQPLMFSTLGEQPRANSYDFFDNDMVTPNLASGTSAVYSPFFLQMFTTERRGIDSGKLYPRDYGDSKQPGTFPPRLMTQTSHQTRSSLPRWCSRTAPRR